MFDGSTLIYIYDGTFEGFLTAVFCAYDRHENPDNITLEDNLQSAFLQKCFYVAADGTKARRVTAGISNKIGPDAFWKVYLAYLYGDAEKIAFEYIKLGLALGPKVELHLTNEWVKKLNDVSGRAGKEGYLLKEFIRFSIMDNGAFYAKITPKANVLPIVTPHFVDRFQTVPFVIHDTGRKLASFYDTKEWYIVSAENLRVPDCSKDEKEYQRLWRAFYDTVAIKQRYNPRCRMNHMPKKFWRNMVEMQENLEEFQKNS